MGLSNSKILFKIIVLSCLLLTACRSGDENLSDSPNITQNLGSDVLWGKCAFVSSEELDKLDILQQKLEHSNDLNQDKIVFEEYIKILNLSSKTDEQLLSCAPSTSEHLQRLMKHFIFLGLSYGKGEFSFVDNPRLASLFEIDYVYNSGNFLKADLKGELFSQADKKRARFLLGGLIAMQASVKMKEGDQQAIVIKNVADGLITLKYGRNSGFNQVLFEYRNNFDNVVLSFLTKDEIFTNVFNVLKKQVSVKTYPMFLKKDKPFWPRDLSEALAHDGYNKKYKSVFGLNSTSGGLALGTGFFARHQAKTIFICAGHWQWGPQLSLMQQKDYEPKGTRPSELVWLKEKLDIINFSQQLIIPILKALDLNPAQIASIKAQNGDNPYVLNKFTLVNYLPWIDMVLGVPSPALIREVALNPDEMFELKSFPEDPSKTYIAASLGFGTTEDLEAGGTKDKSPGFKRFARGLLRFEPLIMDHGTVNRLILHMPLNLLHLEEHPFREQARTIFSMRFGPRCSGAPFFVKNEVAGILQGSYQRKNTYLGLRAMHFTPASLALIAELIADSRGLQGIPEDDLVKAIRKHVYNTDAVRQEIREQLIKAYSL